MKTSLKILNAIISLLSFIIFIRIVSNFSSIGYAEGFSVEGLVFTVLTFGVIAINSFLYLFDLKIKNILNISSLVCSIILPFVLKDLMVYTILILPIIVLILNQREIKTKV